MIHPIPPGTRDVLPDEMRELRRLHLALIEVFEGRGYGEVATPAIEYDEVLVARRRPHRRRGLPLLRRERRPAGAALRHDRADRAPGREPLSPAPSCRCGSVTWPTPTARCARSGARCASSRQAGVELIGAPAPEGTVEVVEVLEAALDAAGLDRAVIGLGDADLYRQLLAEFGIEGEARDTVLARLAAHDLVGLEAELSELEGIGDGAGRHLRRALAAARRPRGARAGARRSAAPRSSGRRRGWGRPTRRSEARGVASRVQIDLGLLRDLGYYSGAILEVYDPALGHVLGGGGRYDGLLKRFGIDLPAAGFALYLERVHVAQMEEERGRGGVDERGVAGMGRAKADGPLKLAVPRGALFGETLDVLDARRHRHRRACAASRAR